VSSKFNIKTAMVVDSQHSALATVAKERSRTMNCDVIFANNFLSPKALVQFLIREQYNQVLFNWRGAIKEGFKTFFFRKTYLRLIAQAKVHALIPDYLGLNPNFVFDEEILLKSVHGYWVTCKDLETKYRKRFPQNFPTGVLHDLPDVQKIRELRNLGRQSEGVIWVGNSKWGERYGYRDLKGYEEIVAPLKRELEADHPSLNFRVFDSAIRRVDNKYIISEIANSQVLVQASESEGTGLPILEALGLGVIPVTTNVGIAAELLMRELTEFIVPRSLTPFRSGVDRALEKGENYSAVCIELFENYIGLASVETITWNASKLNIQWPKPNLTGSIKIWVTWWLRGLRS
jgi:hypothetical protein